MNKEHINCFFYGFCAAVLILAAHALIAGVKTRSVWQNEAVKSGHAEYYLDENNNKQWRWK